MSRYDAVDNLHRCVADLQEAQQTLLNHLATLRLLTARVFELPAIHKGQEHDPLVQITVQQHLAQAALQRAIAHYGRLFIQHQSESLSTKSAVRLPGAICFEADAGESLWIRNQVDTINTLKRRLEEIITVESGVPSEERFEFVHTHMKGLLTLNAYRAITLLDAPDSLRFGWANKNIIKNVSREEMIQKLEKSQRAGRAVAPWTREQWAENVAEEIALINALPTGARLKIKRPVKVQPIARAWNSQQQKQTQLACPSPLLVLCPDAASVPKLGELLNYDANNITHRYKPEAARLYDVIPRLHLYSDCPI